MKKTIATVAGSVDVEMTEAEVTERLAEEAEWAANADSRKAAKERAWRDQELAATDWTQLADAPANVKAKHIAYRQSLRDMPQSADFPLTHTRPVRPL
jgi:hypothetical protein